MSSRAVCPETKDLCIAGCLPRGCKRQVKPRIYFDSGRWHVFMEGWPIHGYLMLSSAYARAETIWSKSKK